MTPQGNVIVRRKLKRRHVFGLSRDGYDRAMNYIGIWRALKSQNRRLYKRLEADAAHVDCLVKMVSCDLAPMARLIGREPHKGSMDSRKRNLAGPGDAQ